MNPMETDSYWQGEAREYCGGKIVDKRVTLHRKIRDAYALSKNEPTGICVER